MGGTPYALDAGGACQASSAQPRAASRRSGTSRRLLTHRVVTVSFGDCRGTEALRVRGGPQQVTAAKALPPNRGDPSPATSWPAGSVGPAWGTGALQDSAQDRERTARGHAAAAHHSFAAYLKRCRLQRRLSLRQVERLSREYSESVSNSYLAYCETGQAAPFARQADHPVEGAGDPAAAVHRAGGLDRGAVAPVELGPEATWREMRAAGITEAEAGRLAEAFACFARAAEMIKALRPGENDGAAARADVEAARADLKMDMAIVLKRMSRHYTARDLLEEILSDTGNVALDAARIGSRPDPAGRGAARDGAAAHRRHDGARRRCCAPPSWATSPRKRTPPACWATPCSTWAMSPRRRRCTRRRCGRSRPAATRPRCASTWATWPIATCGSGGPGRHAHAARGRGAGAQARVQPAGG